MPVLQIYPWSRRHPKIDKIDIVKHMSSSVIDTSMSGPTAASMLFHIIVVGLIMAGTPYIKPDINYDLPVSVNIVNVDKLTQTNKPPINAPKPQRKVKPKDKPPAEIKAKLKQRANAKKPQPPKKAPAPIEKPAIEKPKSPQVPQIENKTPDIQELNKVKLPEPIAIKKPQPQVKDKKEDSKTIDNLLVSLVGEDEPILKDITPPKQDVEPVVEEPVSNIQRLSDRLTISEEDALRAQLSECWFVVAGAKDAQDLVVVVHLTMNPDRTVRTAQLADDSRYGRDQFYTAAADSALRAVKNPQCSPLNLPPNKYDKWKTITVRFDPRDMF